jgi:hypothetical protein
MVSEPTVDLPVASEPTVDLPVASEPTVDLPAPPETVFATRVPPPPPPRPLPATRRAIFFDVENTSRPEHVARVIEHLRLDRVDRQTDLIAVGNWRVASLECARLLARNGAQLVHSAPSTGVRDWSDLRIAVSAGVWLAGARPGDSIEIVSDDRAFDAVGDVAATLGVDYRRLSFRNLAGLRPDEVPRPLEDVEPRGRRRRRGQRGRARHDRPARPTPRTLHEPIHHAPPSPSPEPAAAHTAPHDEIVGIARELILTSERGSVTIDALANALKERGFRRPPGSPRLITRLRRIRELDVSRNGLIALAAGAASNGPVDEPESLAETQDGAPVDVQPAADAAPPRRARRRGRRGGRRHRRRSPEAAAAE